MEVRRPSDYIDTERRNSRGTPTLVLPKPGSKIDLNLPAVSPGKPSSGMSSIAEKWNERYRMRLAMVRFIRCVAPTAEFISTLPHSPRFFRILPCWPRSCF